MSATLTVGMSEAKTNFSRLTADANRTGRTVTVFKNNKPWVEIRPLASEETLPPETLEAVAQVEKMEADANHVRYRTAESLFAALEI